MFRLGCNGHLLLSDWGTLPDVPRRIEEPLSASLVIISGRSREGASYEYACASDDGPHCCCKLTRTSCHVDTYPATQYCYHFGARSINGIR